MADVAQLRKRLKNEIEQARRGAAERRERARAARRDYDSFVETTAVPLFRQVANVLKAEGMTWEVQTPSEGVRLVADRHRDDVIALELDDSQDPPQPMLTVVRRWGSRSLRHERPVKERTAIDQLTEEHLLDRLFEELRPWLD